MHISNSNRNSREFLIRIVFLFCCLFYPNHQQNIFFCMQEYNTGISPRFPPHTHTPARFVYSSVLADIFVWSTLIPTAWVGTDSHLYFLLFSLLDLPGLQMQDRNSCPCRLFYTVACFFGQQYSMSSHTGICFHNNKHKA